MLRTPVFLGLSMAERSHRQVLVVAMYLVLAVLMIAITAASTSVVVFALAWIILTYNVASVSVLGRLVTDMSGLYGIRVGELLSLGLSRKPRDPDEPDERDIAVRNAACFKAYRVIRTYALLLVGVIPGLGMTVTTRLFEVLLAPLLAMAVTLPQAIILRTEPDVPVEAQP